MTNEKELRQLFKNRFDCYADADDVVMAMTEDRFIKTMAEALDLATVVGQSEQLCGHEGTTIAWGPDADKCEKCGLTWDV